MKTKLLIDLKTIELKEQLKKLAVKNGMKMGTYIRTLILKESKKLSTD